MSLLLLFGGGAVTPTGAVAVTLAGATSSASGTTTTFTAGPTVFIYSSDNSTAYEISAETFAIDVGAGRNTELDEFDSGGGTIRCHNLTRNFDPFFVTDDSFLLQANNDRILQANGDGILLAFPTSSAGSYGPIAQGRKVVVYDGPVTVFTGFVEDYDYEWAHGRIASATLHVRDALATLARTTYLEHTRTENQLSGLRITEMLNRTEVGFPAATRSISTGLVVLQGDPVAYGANVLNDLQNIAKTEFGRLFVDRAGVLTFLDRYAVFGSSAAAAINDTGTGLPFSAIGVTFGSEQLQFAVSVDREGGVAQTVTNTTAQAANPNLGARHLALSGLLFTSDAYSKALATYLVDRYSTPQAIVSSIDIPLSKLSLSDRITACALEIGDVVTLEWTPTGTGGVVTQTLAIEGWRYEADHSKRAVMSFQLSDARDPDYFVYDDDSYDGGKVYGF